MKKKFIIITIIIIIITTTTTTTVKGIFSNYPMEHSIGIKTSVILPIISVFVSVGICSGYCARDGTEDSRHSVQVVHTTGVMGLGVLRQEWLRN